MHEKVVKPSKGIALSGKYYTYFRRIKHENVHYVRLNANLESMLMIQTVGYKHNVLFVIKGNKICARYICAGTVEYSC